VVTRTAKLAGFLRIPPTITNRPTASYWPAKT